MGIEVTRARPRRWFTPWRNCW